MNLCDIAYKEIVYSNAEKFIIFNDDTDLLPIKVYPPIPPDLKLIAGYGLKPEQQIWVRPKMPDKLKKIERGADGVARSIEEIWQFLNLNKSNYQAEIDFIETQWYHRLYGYWFFNNGVPTYITGKHYYYLTAIQIDIGYPDYKNRDRKYWIFVDFCLHDTWDFVNKDDKGHAIPDKDGYYHYYDTGRRICLGHIYPKFRREGATYKANADHLETITKCFSANGGIQSRDDEDAKKVFKKLMSSFKKLPFYFKPSYLSSVTSQRKIEFDVVNRSTRGGAGSVNLGLESIIDFGSGLEGDYDGSKLIFYHEDEIGKTIKYDINLRHSTTKECLTTDGNMNIVGYTHKTSTVGEMEGGGGEQFKKLCDNSNFYVRNTLGHTTSMLYRIFISSKDGVSCDIYGNSDEQQAESNFLAQRKAYLDTNNLAEWEESVRKAPLTYSECFTTSSNDIGFNTWVLTTRIGQLTMKRETVKGNFVRIGDIDSPVIFINDELNGRWELSHILDDSETNKKFNIRGTYYPGSNKFVAAADPFKLAKSQAQQTKKLSDGGGAVFMRRDKMIDPDTKDISLWSTNRFVCTYLHRTDTTTEYFDDMLKTCQFFSCSLLPESNEIGLNDYFIENGYGGYLLFLKDKKGVKNAPGVYANEDNKGAAMLGFRNYLQLHGLREKHLSLLLQCKEISALKQLTKYDLLASALWCLVGDEKGYFDHLSNMQSQDSVGGGIDLTKFFRMR